MVKDVIALDDFRKNKKEDFFNVLVRETVDSGVIDNPIIQKIGFNKICFYTATDDNPNDYREALRLTICNLVEQNTFILTVVELSDDDLANLPEDITKEFDSRKWLSSSDKSSENIKEISIEQPEEHTAKDKSDTSRDTKEKSEFNLNDEIDKIRLIKDELSKKVRGQNYAISTVTEAIFDADVFAANNEERKAPLLSFLFVGPSGVGKTYLANILGNQLKKEILTVDLSASFDYKSINSFCRKNKDGIIIFDEIDKAPASIHHLFLQILDEGRLEEISFKDNIVILTTNAGKSLYEDTTRRNLSNVSKRVILEALRTDINSVTGQPEFPECITTRFANGYVILFNHLEPYALMSIVRDEIEQQIKLFENTTGINVEYNPTEIASTVLYNSGGVSDARTLKGTAKSIIVKELYDAVAKIPAKERINIKNISLVVDSDNTDSKVKALFSITQPTTCLIFSDSINDSVFAGISGKNRDFICTSEVSEFKKGLQNIVDFVVIDPLCNCKKSENIPSDIEDYKSDGNDVFKYMSEYYSDVPVYILNSEHKDEDEFATLISKGAKGVVEYSVGGESEFREALKILILNSLINNSAYSLTRANKSLNYNCAQYISQSGITISFECLTLKQNLSSADNSTVMFGNCDSGETFDDVIGCKAAKEAMKDICDCIKNQREYLLSGRKIPKGILMYGKPGTGKTMLARALANEVGAAFIPTNATSFYNKYVGQTEENIRNLFATARKYAPAVLFVDEVDGIAKNRTGESSMRHSEDALTTFLAQMDGFVKDDSRPVFVVAATNYSIDGNDGPALDPAFVRRFDKRVYFDYPDTDDRFEMFSVLLEKHGVNFEGNHNQVLKNLAARSAGMSNADIVSMLDCFIRSNYGKAPTPASIMDAIDSFRYGEIKTFDDNIVKQTAYHEAGHALVYRLLGKTPSYLTIVSRGNFGGYMAHESNDGKAGYTYNELLDNICVSLAGRCSETLVYGDDFGNNTGASSDIENARNTLKAALEDYAMGDKLYEKPESADFERIMQAQYDRATKLLTDNRNILDSLVSLLVKEKSLDQVTLDEFFNSKSLIK